MKTSEIKVDLIDSMGSDLSVVNAARVSFDKESDWEWYVPETGEVKDPDWDTFGRLSDKDSKLITYLAKHKHKSPFNHAFLSFRIKAPIFVARQLVKHEYLPWNEVSRRYVSESPEFYVPVHEWRMSAKSVKQGSSDHLIDEDSSVYIQADFEECVELARNTYNFMIKAGVCPEQARMVLPQNMYTEWIWSGSLYAFMKMCKLRLDPHTQKETREVAEKIFKEIEFLFPVSAKALLEYIE